MKPVLLENLKEGDQFFECECGEEICMISIEDAHLDKDNYWRMWAVHKQSGTEIEYLMDDTFKNGAYALKLFKE